MRVRSNPMNNEQITLNVMNNEQITQITLTQQELNTLPPDITPSQMLLHHVKLYGMLKRGEGEKLRGRVKVEVISPELLNVGMSNK